MKKLFFIFVFLLLTSCVFAFSVSAAQTNEFGTPELSNSINLENMAEDDDVYCVLFDGTEYHTYPSRYIVTNSTTMTWKFDNINAAFGKSYGATSVIRIQVPCHVTLIPCITNAYFGWQAVTTLLEVSFPKDTSVTTFAWGAFEKCTGLESIVIPKTVTLFDGVNTFSGCTGLKSVVFEEGSQLKALPRLAFGNTLSLTEIVLPPSITSIGENVLGGHAGKLEKVVLSPNLSTVLAGGLLNALGRNESEFIEVYMPACFATGEGSISSGNLIGRGDKSDLKRYVIFFTGTEEQAKALVSKFSGDVSLFDANIVSYDATKSSAQDYLGMEPYTTDIAVNTNRVIVFGYGVCDAFYKGAHQMAGEAKANITSYFDAISIGDKCTRDGCGEMILASTIAPIFIDYGYSATETAINGRYAISQFFGVNLESLDEYNKFTGKELVFGLVTSTTSCPLSEENKDLISKNMTVVVEKQAQRLDAFQIKLTGLTEKTVDTAFTICAFVIDGKNTFYLDNGKTVDAVTQKSYNQILALISQ